MAREIPFKGAKLETIEVPRTARYALLGTPSGAVREVWYVLHGYGQLALSFLKPFERLGGGKRIVVAPEALSRFYVAPMDRAHGAQDPVGASWMTREERGTEIRDYVRFLDVLAQRVEGTLARDEVRRVVLGFSQGCHTAARWTALGEVRPGLLVLWGAGLPPDPGMDVLAPALRRSRLVFVRGREDAHRNEESERGDERRLEEAGVSFEVRWHPKDHRIHRITLERLAAEV